MYKVVKNTLQKLLGCQIWTNPAIGLLLITFLTLRLGLSIFDLKLG